MIIVVLDRASKYVSVSTGGKQGGIDFKSDHSCSYHRMRYRPSLTEMLFGIEILGCVAYDDRLDNENKSSGDV